MPPSVPNITAIPTPPLQVAAIFIVWFFTILALVAFLLRVWSRLRVTRQWGFDDWLMVPAEICSIGLSVPFFMYMKLGYFGYRAVDVPDFDPSPGLYVFYIAQIFYNPILALVKCSVIVFILRLCGRSKDQQKVRWAAYGIIAFTAAHAIAVFFVVVLQCLPIEAVWDLTKQKDAKCIDPSFHVAISSLTVFTDILVLALPFYIFLGLQMHRATKVAVLGCFALGAAVTAVSIARIVGVVRLFYFPEQLGDPYHSLSVTLSVVEPNLAIATACIPALRPMFKTYFPSVFGSSNKASGYMSSHRRFASGGALHKDFMSEKASHSRSHSRKPSSYVSIPMNNLRPNKRWTNSQSQFRNSTESDEKALHETSQEDGVSIMVTTDVTVQSSISKIPEHVRTGSRGAVTSQGSERTFDQDLDKHFR